nr:hypothetical protein [Nocardia suismassiliense]
MHIRSRRAEAGDTRQQTPIRELYGGSREFDRSVVPIDRRIELVDVQTRRHRSVPQAENRFDQTYDTRSGLSVTYVGFHRSHEAPASIVGAFAENGRQGRELNPVSRGGAGAVRLHKIEIGRIDSCRRIRGP